jgi:hypothetical protein
MRYESIGEAQPPVSGPLVERPRTMVPVKLCGRLTYAGSTFCSADTTSTERVPNLLPQKAIGTRV